MPLTATKLRADLYRILDRAIETGEPVEILRHGKLLKIVPPERRSKLASLVPHPEYLDGDLEQIVHLDWSSEWQP